MKKNETNNDMNEADHTDIWSAIFSLSISDKARNVFPSMRFGSVASASEPSNPHSNAIAFAVWRLSPVTMRTCGSEKKVYSFQYVVSHLQKYNYTHGIPPWSTVKQHQIKP
jgi:hypothetical protein